MDLSVTSAPGALAALQALSSQSVAQNMTQAAGPTTLTTAAPAPQPARDASAASATQSLYARVNGAGEATTAADAADVAGRTVLGLLQQLREAAGSAADPATSSAARAALDARFQAGAAAIPPALDAAAVGGVNLIDGSLSTDLKVTLADGTSASLTPADLSLRGGASIATATAAASVFATLGEAIGTAGSALSTLRTQADRISAHAGFVQALGQAARAPGDADGDRARLLALQVSQQLSGLSTPMANASPQSILSLFRS